MQHLEISGNEFEGAFILWRYDRANCHITADTILG